MLARRRLARALLAISLLWSVSCATGLSNPEVSDEALDEERSEQMALAVRTHLDRQARLERVGKRIAMSSADLCGEDVDHAYGITWASGSAIAEPYRAAAGRIGLTGGVQIWATVPRLPGARAKLRKGTRVVNVNGKSVLDFESLSDAIRPSWESGKLRLELESAPGKPLRDITLRGVRACRYDFVVAETDAVNAFADGDRVIVTKGMMRFADRDDELALVVGHEIAHNVLGHVREKKVTQGIARAPGMLLDFAAGLVGISTGGGFSALGGAAGAAATRGRARDFESDADYMGLYMARRARFDVSNAHLFWREMAAEYPGSIKGNMLSSHPTSPARSASLRSAMAEIRGKEKKGRPLVPNPDEPVPASPK